MLYFLLILVNQNIILIFLMMEIQQTQRPVLIYYKARGIAQIIRFVLLEIGVDFEEVFVTCSGYLDPEIVKKFNIDLKSLPYLIHYNKAYTGIFPIIKYCCTQFNRVDLLGKNLLDTVQITQIMTKEIRQKGIMLHTLFNGLKEVYQKKLGEAGMQKLKQKMLQLACNKQLQPLMAMFSKSKGYFFGYLTIVDFMYYDKTFYATNVFLGDFPEMELAKAYKQFIQTTQFFIKNEQRIKQYKVFFPQTDCNVNMLIRQMWIGDPSYICQG